VVDEGRSHGAEDTGTSPEPGRGITGMRERCQLLGGDLTAMSRPGGGFEVKARLPLVPTGAANR
jgi:signal transduction histidine kinase